MGQFSICDDDHICRAICISEKLKIIKVEHKNFSTIWDKLLRFIPESISLSSLNIRENLILETLKEPQEYYQEEYLQEFVKSLNLIYISYILFYIKVQIANNHIIDIFQTLYNKLENKLSDTNKTQRPKI